MSDNKKVLFLNDMETRHKAFKHALRFRHDLDFTYVYTALDAINALDAQHFDQAFLDHDLSIDDIMCEPGDHEATVPTGMAVVDHILTMERPPSMVCVRAYNEVSPAGEYFYAMQVPFPHLITQLL